MATTLNTTPAKRGRKPLNHRCSWDNKEIDGLYRKPGGNVWRVRATGQEFTEPDERRAVARFYELTQRKPRTVRLQINPALATEPPAVDLSRVRGTYVPPDYVPPAAPAGSQRAIQITMNEDGTLRFTRDVDERGFFETMKDLLLKQPEYCAAQTGIEWLAWHEHQRPEKAVKMEELIECYAAKPGLTDDEVSRCRRFWKEFVNTVGIQTIRELTHERVEAYEAKVEGMALAPKSIKHRYTRVRTVIAYAMKRGKGQADCRQALDKLAMLEVENVNTLDPNPIDPAAFWKIHAAAEKAGDKVFACLMLFALNAAMYSSEVGAVRWDEVDLKRGEFVTRRNKTKVPRVAVLWPETVKALKALSHDRETVFNTSVQGYNRFSVHRDWTKYRKAAKVKDGVVFAMIRDASFTTACRHSLDQARVLAGHRLPGAVDHYVMRNPQYVAEACEAIRTQFLAAKRNGKGKAA